MQQIVTTEAISVFDILKIGVGPSSSHTLGPWRASTCFVKEIFEDGNIKKVDKIIITLYGSLALTGRGHGTDIAVILGLNGNDPETVPLEKIASLPRLVKVDHQLKIADGKTISFNPSEDILYLKSQKLPYHSNAMKLQAFDRLGKNVLTSIYYSIGGGFIINDEDINKKNKLVNDHILPFPSESADDLLKNCSDGRTISQVVRENELSWRKAVEIDNKLRSIWDAMKESVFKGCHTEGLLPGGLDVVRRASALRKRLDSKLAYKNVDEWIANLQKTKYDFSDIIIWIGCFAMAVNEENASFGRIVTAPTNGSAGVIPAVLLYYICFSKKEVREHDIFNFLMVAGEIGSLFKKGSTISAAMGGCQAEIGVSSAMAAAALTECLGGTVAQVLMAAEIAMEHHLGMTCDPIGGLVQIPCIERNCMGAVKAITASKIAMDSDPAEAKVSLDDVIKTMWDTAKDMSFKYKETSQGGLAVNISVKVPEC